MTFSPSHIVLSTTDHEAHKHIELRFIFGCKYYVQIYKYKTEIVNFLKLLWLCLGQFCQCLCLSMCVCLGFVIVR